MYKLPSFAATVLLQSNQIQSETYLYPDNFS